MQISNQGSWPNSYLLSMAKSFFIWTLTLTVCFLVIGFPLVVVLMTVGVLSAIILQSVLPASAILLVSAAIGGGIMMVIMVSSVLLAVRGVNPKEVKWLGWLREKKQLNTNPIYASCPLTCSVTQL